MKRILCLILSLLLLMTLFSACSRASKLPAAAEPEREPEPARTLRGCAAAEIGTPDRTDGVCTVVILNTEEGRIGLLILRGTEISVPSPDGDGQIVVRADGCAESQYFNRDAELCAEGCVRTEKPGDLELIESAEAWYRPETLAVLTIPQVPETTAKPVIYLYPETETAVSVRLDFAGQLTCTYPAYETGWTVTAAPDGTLTDAVGQTYRYLFWEGEGGWQPDFSRGFCVSGAETEAFLELALAELGLTRDEANEFIVYWLPQMQENPWNLISFQQAAYTDSARLEITPTPDTVLRVFMAWRPLSEPVEIAPQSLEARQRTGFTVVEWGGRRVE